MLGNVLIYITAFMCICGSRAAINFQPVPPFSVNFLHRVSDFDNIVEPEYEGNAIETRESVDEEQGDCPSGKCPRFVEDSQAINERQEPLEEADVKRDLREMGNTNFDYEEPDKRYERDFQAVQDEKEEKVAEKEESSNNITDPDFLEQQAKAQNLSNASKNLLEEIENPKLELEEQEGGECCEQAEKDEKPGKAVAFVKDTSGKAKMGSGDFLEMHFYRKIPETGRISHHKKPFVISLRPSRHKSHIFATPKKYNLVALIAKGNNKYVQVPAIKFKVVPESIKKRTSGSYEPFFVTDNKKIFHHRVPVYFANTLPRMKRRFSSRFKKRSTNYDVPDNEYMRTADMVVENIKTLLKMDVGRFRKPSEVDSGLAINSQYQNSPNSNNKKVYKKEITEKMEANVNVGENSDNEFIRPLVNNNNNLVRNGEIMAYSDNLQREFAKNDGNKAVSAQDNSQKNKMNSEENAPKDKNDNSMRSETHTNYDASKKVDPGAYSELNSFLAKSKYESLLKTRIALMKGTQSEVADLIENDGSNNN